MKTDAQIKRDVEAELERDPSNELRTLDASAHGENLLAIEHAQSTRRGSRQNQNRHQVEIPVWQHPVDLLETKLRNSS